MKRRTRVEFLTDERTHGNMGNIQKLGEPLRIDVSLYHRVPYNNPLNSSSGHQSIIILHDPGTAGIHSGGVFFVIVIIEVVIELSRSSRSIGPVPWARKSSKRLRSESEAAEQGHGRRRKGRLGCNRGRAERAA